MMLTKTASGSAMGQGTRALANNGASASPVSSPRLGVTRLNATGQETATTTRTEEPKYKNITPPDQAKGQYSVSSGQMGAVAGAALPAFLRLGSGAFVWGPEVSKFKRPAKPLDLYEFEGCPFCKKVREAVSILDLDVNMYPCPKDGATWRPKAIQMGGKKQFPYLVDPNNGKSMYESDAIIKYLFQEYGPGRVPLLLNLGPLTTLSAGLGLAGRFGHGIQARPSKLPEKPLTLWGYDASPFVKLTRETLTELEIPYLYRNVARNSPKRQEMMAKGTIDKFQVPYLEDPNTGSCMVESAVIIKYLNDNYGR